MTPLALGQTLQAIYAQLQLFVSAHGRLPDKAAGKISLSWM